MSDNMQQRKQQIAKWVDSIIQTRTPSPSSPSELPMLLDECVNSGTIRESPQTQHGQFMQQQQQHGQYVQQQGNFQYLQQQGNGQFVHQPPQQQYVQFMQQPQQHGQYVRQQENGQFPLQQHQQDQFLHQKGNGKFSQPQQQQGQILLQQGNGQFLPQQRNGKFPQQQQQQLARSVQPVNQIGTSSSSTSSSISELPLLQQEYCVSSSSIQQSPNNCKVCGDVRPLINGKEPALVYQAIVCTSCQQFFKRSKNWEEEYKCKSGGTGGNCQIRVDDRRCRLCRIHKCLAAGMDWPPEVEEGTYEPCLICHGTTSKLANHYGVKGSCEGCKCFFLRVTKSKNASVACTCKKCDTCIRYQTCLDAGMDRTKIKRGRPSRKNI